VDIPLVQDSLDSHCVAFGSSPGVKVPHTSKGGVALYDPRRPRRCARPDVAMNPFDEMRRDE
jgi:hypothetical protein